MYAALHTGKRLMNGVPSFTRSSIVSPGTYFAAWWSASDHGTANMTDSGGGVITAWADWVGGLSMAGASTPTWSAGAMNVNYPGITGDGVDDVFVTTTLTNLPTSTADSEIWLVGAANGSGAIEIPVAYGGNTGGTSRAIRKSAANRAQISDGTNTLGDTLNLMTAPFIAMGRFTGVLETGFFNGGAFPANPMTWAGSTNTTRMRAFANNGTAVASPFAGVISEIVIAKVITANVVLPGRTPTLEQDLLGLVAWGNGAPGKGDAVTDLVSKLPPTNPWRWRPPN